MLVTVAKVMRTNINWLAPQTADNIYPTLFLDPHEASKVFCEAHNNIRNIVNVQIKEVTGYLM